MTPQFARIFGLPSRSPYLLSCATFWTAPCQKRPYDLPRLKMEGRLLTVGRLPHSSPMIVTGLSSDPPLDSAAMRAEVHRESRKMVRIAL